MAVSVALDHMPPTNTATGRSPQRPCQGQIPHALDHVARHFTSVRSKERSLQTNLALLLVEVRYVLSLRLGLLTTVQLPVFFNTYCTSNIWGLLC